MKKNFLLSFVAIFPLVLSGCDLLGANTPIIDGDSSGNPASIYCEENGGTLEIVPDEGGSRGKCNFEDGSFCEEWAYYHGECGPNRGHGNTISIDEIQENDEINGEFVDLVEELGEKELLDAGNSTENEEEENIETVSNVCPQDQVKKCDDGTFLVREGADCEYGTCPGYPLDDKIIQNILHQYENDGSELNENDIDLMNEIIDVMTKI